MLWVKLYYGTFDFILHYESTELQSYNQWF
jgi:hypothetical protein